MDGMEPEFFLERGVGAEPDLENIVGSLPVMPIDSGFVDGASLSAKVVNVERFEDESWITFGFL